MSSPIDVDFCPPIEGNPDLYGLGIRVGVYLQWFSSWFSMLVEPSSAQEIHEVNSVFVFAIIIATILAARAQNLFPVEAFVMLQFSFGYFFTTMSIIGLRVQVMSPARLAVLLDAALSIPRRLHESLIGQPFLKPKPAGASAGTKEAEPEKKLKRRGSLVRQAYHFGGFLHVYSLNMPMAAISFLKPAAMSWSGVLWRTVIAGMVSGFNLWFWFYGLDYLVPTQPCVTDVFIFSQQRLLGPVVALFKTLAILVAFPAFFLCLYLGLISLRLTIFFVVCLYREIIFQTAESIEPGSVEKFQATLRKVEPLMQPLEVFTQAGTFGVVNVVPWMAPEFWATPLAKIPRFTDILKVFAALAGGGVTSDKPESSAETVKVRAAHKVFCAIWHAIVILAMIYFVLAIELTLHWNDVQGINDIDSTGQLIPFIIGVVSTAQALKKVAITTIKKLYPDWTDTELTVRQDLFGNAKFQIGRKTDKLSGPHSFSMPELPILGASLGRPASR